MITLAYATSRVAECLRSLAPEDLKALMEATRGALTPSENKQYGLIARIMQKHKQPHFEIARLYYYTLKELPAEAELLKAEINLINAIKDNNREENNKKCQPLRQRSQKWKWRDEITSKRPIPR